MTIPQVVPEIMRGAGPLDEAGVYYLDVNGAVGARATTPDVAALDITGDMEVRVDATLVAWQSPPTTGMELFGKFVPPSNQSWVLWVNANRRLVLRHSADGTAAIDNVCSAPLPIVSGRLAVSVIIDVNNGVGGHTVFFRTAPTIAGPWTTLGTSVTGGTTSIFNSTATMGVGDVPSSGFARPTGRFHAAQLIAGTAGTDFRANPNFAVQPPGTTSFADAAGRTWTVGSPATIGGFDWEAIPDEVTDTGTRQRLRTLTWDVGRDNELDRFSASSATAEFRSNDRLLDPEHTGGALFGDLLPQVPLRFRAVAPAADLFYGFPTSGWQQTYEKPFASKSTVTLTDLLGVIEGTALPETAYEAEVLANNPSAFWRLDERSGTQMADSSGNGRHGLYDNSILGEDPLVLGGGGSVRFPHVGDNRGQWSGQGLPVAAPCTLEAWVQTDRDALAIKTIIAAQVDYSLGSALALQIHPAASGSPDGELVIDFFGLGSFYKARGHTRIDDNEPHHVVCVISGAGTSPSDIALYVDGVLQTKTTVSGTNPGPWSGHLIWTVGNTTDNGQGDYGFDGLVDEAAIYSYALSAEQVAANYEAGAAAFTGELSGTRINRVLDIVGVPESLRDIADGDTPVGPAVYGGSTVGEYLGRVVESEQGALYVDHPGGGKLKFRGRYARLTEARSTTSQATFTDNDTLDGWCYRNDIAPEPNGADTIVNTVKVAWQGGSEIVTDDDSIAAYGARSRDISTEASTPQAARSAGAWLIGRYSQPQARIRRLPLGPGGGQAGLDAVVLGQHISDRITVERHPQGVGSPIVNELIVEGIRNEMNLDGSWYATYNTSNADDSEAWIWGLSTWGETYWG